MVHVVPRSVSESKMVYIRVGCWSYALEDEGTMTGTGSGIDTVVPGILGRRARDANATDGFGKREGLSIIV